MRRVVITGVGVISPIGSSTDEVYRAIVAYKSGVQKIEEWDSISGLKSRIAGRVNDFDEKCIPREFRRTMDRVAMICAKTAIDAIADSGLAQHQITNPKTGISFGSAMGGLDTLYGFASSVKENNGFKNIPATSFLKFMSHTVSANLAVMLNIIGKNIPNCSACTASSQSIGAGYEAIKSGHADIMVCGGGDGLHFVQAGVFDSMSATVKNYNNNPTEGSRPFDKKREGLVVAEGGGTIILEEYKHAKKRGANIYAELAAYETNCDGTHITLPSKDGMKRVMENILKNAGVGTIDYINAHATGTIAGDISESHALYEIFKDSAPVSSTKGYTGHMFGGSGVFESIVTLISMQKDFLCANMNLLEVDSNCAPLDYLMSHREKKISTAMSNNFAFGGINTSLVFKKV